MKPGAVLAAASCVALALAGALCAAHVGTPARAANAARTRSESWLTPEQRAAAQRAPLRELLAAAGGLAAYEAGEGLGFDLLETLQVLVQREPPRWSVHHRLAQRVVLDRAGRGYAWIEYASFDAARASAAPRMQRAAWNGEQGWTETSGVLDAAPGAAERARTRVERAHLLGALPFSLLALECAEAFESLGAARLGDERVERWSARLASPLEWAEDGRFEWIELALADGCVRRLSLVPAREPSSVPGTSVRPQDGARSAEPDRGAALHFDCEVGLECGPLRLPRRVASWRAGAERRVSFELAAPAREAPPPEALRFPAAREAYYAPPRRAASWDGSRALQRPAEAGR